MKKIKYLVAAAVSGLTIASAPAIAGVIAMSDLSITSLGLVSGSDLQPVTQGILITTDARTGTAASNYNGIPGVGVGPDSISSFIIGDPVDVKYRCAGPDCGAVNATYGGLGAENNVATHFTAPVGNFALGDMYLSGSAVGASGAQGLTRADASANGPTNSGGSNSTILNSAAATTTFTAMATMDVNFALTYDAFIKTWIDPLMVYPEHGTAGAGYNFILTVYSTDDMGFAPLVWMPTPLNQAFTTTNSSENHEFSSIGGLLSDSRTLTSGKHYNVTINQSSNALVQDIPEPASLALAGLGLIGLAVQRRRKIAS